MRSIDIHTHLVPQCMWNILNAGGEWYGMKYNNADKTELFIKEGRVRAIPTKVRYTPEQRLQDMDAEGTDVQVVSVHTQVFGYHLDPAGVWLRPRILTTRSRRW